MATGLEAVDGLRTATITVLDAVARDAMQHGCSPIHLWPQLATRIVASARTSAGPEEWASRMLRGMRITNPGPVTSAAISDLVTAIGTSPRDRSLWLSLVERECGFLVASLRAARDEKRAAWEAENPEAAAKAKAARKPRKGKAETQQTAPTEGATDPTTTENEQETLWKP